MKKIIALLLFGIMFVYSHAEAQSNVNLSRFTAAIQNTVKAKDSSITVSVEKIDVQNSSIPKGFIFVKIIYKKDGKEVGRNYAFTDGSVIAQDFLTVSGTRSLAGELKFDAADVNKIDPKQFGLTLIAGNPNAKNVIIEVTDFQCPFCKEASRYIHNQIKNRKDVAVYIVHMPLSIHPNAPTMAAVFEAGMLMGKNFEKDLFNSKYAEELQNLAVKLQQDPSVKNDAQLEAKVEEAIKNIDNKIIEDYAAKSGNPAKFKKLLKSKEITAQLEKHKAFAKKYNVESTPTIFVNGKAVSGFDEPILNKAFNSIK